MRAVRGETRVGNITSAVGSYWVADPQAAVAAVADVRLSTRSQPQEVSLVLARAVMNVWTERLDEAWSDLHQVLPVVRRRGPFVELLIAHLYLTDAAYRSGRWDDAIAHGELAVSATRDGDQVFLLALTHGAAAWARAARGDWDAAEAHCEAARQAADALGDLGSRIWSQLAAARLAHARGDAASVAAPLEELASAQHTTGLRNPAVQPWEGLFAEALVDLGRLDEAEAVVDLMDHGPGTGTLRSTASEVARIRGLLAAARREPGSAEAFLVRAVELAGPIGQPFLLARSQLALGSFFRRQGRSADAQRVLSVAERGFSRLRAGPYQERVGRELEAIGRRGAPSIELSPQERAVAVLVAEGLSNRDVAARLVISVKTVEYHVRNIYDKLGIRSRSALTRYVIEQELG
jgi:DNA-binding NarL/FixJ family response regulator